ncbi:hypothetical protein ABZW49_32290 [Nonomuraea wenchangensis]
MLVVRPAVHQRQHRTHPLGDPVEERVPGQAGEALGPQVDVAEGDVVELEVHPAYAADEDAGDELGIEGGRLLPQPGSVEHAPLEPHIAEEGLLREAGAAAPEKSQPSNALPRAAKQRKRVPVKSTFTSRARSSPRTILASSRPPGSRGSMARSLASEADRNRGETIRTVRTGTGCRDPGREKAA